jgi:hypothetical protein
LSPSSNNYQGPLNSSEFFQKIGSDPTRRAEYEARADKATKEEKKAAGPPAPAKSELLELLKNLFPEGLPLLVACIKGTKKPVVKWGKLTEKKCEEDDGYWPAIKRAIEEGGNIAVKLGPASDNLCVIDFDDDDLVAPFLEANPAFAETLCTRGSKGCSFWFYVIDEYPQEVKRIHIGERSRELASGAAEKGSLSCGACIPKEWSTGSLTRFLPVKSPTRRLNGRRGGN